MRAFFSELKRRNVVRVGIAYTIVGWVLLQVADVLFPALTLPEWTNRLLAALLLLGFPLALLFAWVYELTPEGLKREQEVDRRQSVTGQTSRKLDFIIIAMFAVAVALLLWDRFGGRGAPDAPSSTAASETVSPGDDKSPQQEKLQADKSIAVLPFADMSPGQDQAYLSDGIAEELLNLLVRVEGVKVASRTSSFAFKGSNASIPDIASKLRVDHVLEGSVRKAGDQVRITAQLIDVKSDRHLWSKSFDRKLADIFAIQDEISREIVSALKVSLGAEQARRIQHDATPTSNVEAYQLFLRGRALWQRRGERNIRTAIDLFNEATTLDPQFARAWAALAAAHLTLPAYTAEARFEMHWPLAEQHADMALSLDPDIAECFSIKGDIQRNRGHWLEAEQNYQRALQLEADNATAHLWYSEFLNDVGKTADALAHLQAALAVDPLSPGANSDMAETLFLLGDFEQAEKYALIAVELSNPGGPFWLFQINQQRGDIAAARRHLADFQDLLTVPDENRFDDEFFTAMADPAAIPALRARLASIHNPPQEVMVRSYVAHGLVEEAIEYIYENNSRPEVRWNGATTYWWRPDMGPLRQSPGFRSLVRQAGLERYWQENGWPPNCYPQGQDFYCE